MTAIAHEHGFKELLAIGVDAAGARHAIYPTASRALCGHTDDGLEVAASADCPGCAACATTAAVFDGIDSSAPASWFRGSGERAATWAA